MASQGQLHRPFFSVIIPTYNREALVCRAIDSCLNQTFPDFELLVVDDGSTDNTEVAVKKYVDQRVRYVRQQNAGGAVARNHGAQLAQAGYLSFLDSDDEFLPEKLACVYAAITAPGYMPSKTVLYSQLLFARGEGNVLVKPGREIKKEERVGDYLFARDGLLQTSTLVMQKSLFDQVRFDSSLRSLQDLDLCLRLEAAGARFAMVPRPLVTWFDTSVADRVSYSTSLEEVAAWVEARRPLLSKRAYSGFLARNVAPRLIRTAPVQSARLLSNALRHGSISPGRAASVFSRGLAPKSYAWMRDSLVTLRARSRRRRV